MTNQQVLNFCKIVMIIGIIFEFIWFVIELLSNRTTEWIMPFTLFTSQSAVFLAIFGNKEKDSHEDSQKRKLHKR